MQDKQWFATCYRQGFKNLGGESLEKFDARKLARYWKEVGAELVFMNAMHGWEILYPSEIRPMCEHLKGRDLLGELVDECGKIGIRSGAYTSPLVHSPALKDHPEWRQTRTDGTFFGENPQGVLTSYYWGCWNSGYLDEVCSMFREIFSRYPLDACFIDGMTARHGVCHCPSCVSKFKADTGYDLPGAHDLENPAFRAYLKWKATSMAVAERRLVEAAHVKDPAVQTVTNTPMAWCNWCAGHSVEFAEAAEFLCVEVHPDFSEIVSPAHYSGIKYLAYKIAYTRGQSMGFPKVQAYRYLGELNLDIGNDVLMEAKAALSQGGLHCIMGHSPQLREAYEYTRKCEPYLIDTTPLLWAGLAASQESSNTQFVNDAVQGRFFEDICGSYGALLDAKLPVEFINEKELCEIKPDRFPLLILSDMGYVNPQQADAIRGYVKAGGGLLATARTSLIGENGKVLENFALADLLGVDAVAHPRWKKAETYAQENTEACLEFEETPWWGDAVQEVFTADAGDADLPPWIGGSTAHPFYSAFQAVKARPGAKVHAWMRPLSGDAKERLPGIVEFQYGKGRVLYVAPRMGELYSRYPFPAWRRVLDFAVRHVSKALPPVEVVAPLSVSLYPWEQANEKRWVIHLINDLDQTGRPRGRMPRGKNQFASNPREGTIPVHGVELIVRKPGATRAILPLENRELALEPEGDAFRIRLGRMEQHVMLVVS